MPEYAYRCRSCGFEADSPERHDSLGPCPNCPGELRRQFILNFGTVMQDHYNPSVGRVISDKRQHAELLKRQSEAATARTGIYHNYVPVDPADARSVHGVTEEGLYESAKRKHDRGLPNHPPNVV